MHRKYYYLFFRCACTRGHVINALEWLPIRREGEWRLAMKRKRMNKMQCNKCGLVPRNKRGLVPRSLVGLPRTEEHSTPLPLTLPIQPLTYSCPLGSPNISQIEPLPITSITVVAIQATYLSLSHHQTLLTFLLLFLLPTDLLTEHPNN